MLSGNPTKAKTAYQDFLSLWKDADREIPILEQAQAECLTESLTGSDKQLAGQGELMR